MDICPAVEMKFYPELNLKATLSQRVHWGVTKSIFFLIEKGFSKIWDRSGDEAAVLSVSQPEPGDDDAYVGGDQAVAAIVEAAGI